MRRSTLLFILASAVGTTGCAQSDPEPDSDVDAPAEAPPETPAGEDVAETASDLSPAKMVPLRFVHLLPQASCTTATPCAGNVSSRRIRAAVDKANTVYEPAGIKLWIKSEERVNAPNLSDIDDVLSFATVKNELRKIFPNLPTNAYFDGDLKITRYWLAGAAAFYGADDEVVIYIWPGGGSQSAGTFPEEGRSIRLMGNHLTGGLVSDPSHEVASNVLAHELGHYFGLRHTFDSPWGTNPQTGNPWTVADRWNEFYCNDWDAPLMHAGEAIICSDPKPMDPTCVTIPSGNGQPRCAIPGGATFYAGNYAISGLFKQISGVTHDPPDSYAYGGNVMGYWGSADWALDAAAPAFVSPTQIAIMDKYLTYSAPFTNVGGFMRGAGFWPLGMLPNATTNRRELLGTDTDDFISYSPGPTQQNGKFSFSTYPKPVSGTDYVPVSGDFNGDGRADILWYRPSDTTARFWWGRDDRTFDHDTRTGFFPETGYTVFAGDFDGDGDADLFLYKPGSGQDRIRHHLYSKVFTSTGTDTLKTVNGTYTPIVGDFDGNGKDDIYWYVPASAYVHRWFATGSMNFTAYDYVNMPSPNAVPIVGDFDNNGADDLFWYVAGGSDTEKIWFGPQTGTNTTTHTTNNVVGTYEPLAGDFDGDGFTDILWDAKNSQNDAIWAGKPGYTFDRGGAFDNASVTHSGKVSFYGAFNPVAGDFDGDGSADIMWYRE